MTDAAPDFDALCDDAVARSGVTPRDDEQRRVLGMSEFLVRAAQRGSDEFQGWLDRRPYETAPTPAALRARCERVLDAHPPERAASRDLPALQRALRTLRNDVQRVLVWRHLARRASFEETVAALCALADAMLDTALAWCEGALGRSEAVSTT